MKKIVLAALLAALCVGLCACGEGASDTASSTGGVSRVSPAASAPGQADETQSSILSSTSAVSDNTSFFQSVKDYILTGQEQLSEAEKLHWSKSFLEAVDFQTQYDAYLAAGSKADDTKAFAEYLTENAAAPENWKDLFQSALMSEYSKVPVRYEELGDGMYQVYVENEGKQVPYVTVNSRTGWYHG